MEHKIKEAVDLLKSKIPENQMAGVYCLVQIYFREPSALDPVTRALIPIVVERAKPALVLMGINPRELAEILDFDDVAA